MSDFNINGWRKGPTWMAIDPFTPDEHWVQLPDDYVEPPAPADRAFVVTAVDYEKRTVTFASPVTQKKISPAVESPTTQQ